MPVEQYKPFAQSIAKPPPAGIGKVRIGVSVPTVGADALL
jgi:hypothetical protein